MPKSRSSSSDESSLIEVEILKKENNELEESVKVKKDKKFDVEQFRKLKDLPAWFRTLSNNQLAAADCLLESIRDDIEQNTTHRCRLALWRLGLYPLEPAANIKFVINLSRGNDLAFLWFLMELFYLDTCGGCDHPKTEYNVNQQILMSSIAHLDMVVTLRELDRIAPRPPKPEPKKRSQVEKPEKKTYRSPLLEPLPRPKVHVISKNAPPLRPVQVLRYAHLCNDPNYFPPNEWNRWYSWPKEQQKNLDFGFDETQGGKIVRRVLRDHLYSVLKGRTEQTDAQKFFEKEKERNLIEHRMIQEEAGKFLAPNERKRIEAEKNKTVVGRVLREHLFSLLDRSDAVNDRYPLCGTHLQRQEEENMKKKIKKVKKRDYAREFFGPNEKKRTRRRRIIKQIEQDVQNIQDERDESLEYQELHTWIKCFVTDLIWNATTQNIVEKGCDLEKACSIEEIQKNQTKKIDKSHCALACVDDFYDFGHFGKPKPNEIYFHAPSQNKPYNFDYPKIFKDDVEEKKDPIKNAISNALDLDDFANEDEAVNSWLKSTWKKEVKESNEENGQKKEEKLEEKKIIKPSQTEMDEILENCFQKMKENPKFVFASLPDGHKHPSVRMWLRQRFGILRISEKEREEALENSKKILHKLSKQKYTIHPPTIGEITKEKVASYDCNNYVCSKTKRVLQKFYHEYKMIYLENCRTFWELMEPRHCAVPPYEMFYAYMPYREYDIMPFKPWKPHEFVNAAECFRKRRVKEAMEAKCKL